MLSEPVDVYSEWIDACEAANKAGAEVSMPKSADEDLDDVDRVESDEDILI